MIEVCVFRGVVAEKGGSGCPPPENFVFLDSPRSILVNSQQIIIIHFVMYLLYLKVIGRISRGGQMPPAPPK